jgi:Xaa-Pro dipeptidase
MTTVNLYQAHIAELTAAYERVMASENLDAIVLQGGVAKKKSQFDDQWFPLRMLPHFQHWAPGFSEAGATLVLTAGKRPKLFWEQRENFWERAPEPDWNFLGGALDLERAEWKPGSGKQAVVAEGDAGNAELVAKLDALRTRKSAFEIACMKQASERAARGHAALRRVFSESDASELELHLQYLAVTEQDDSETPYKNIVARGSNAGVLHHIAYGRSKRAGADSLLLDAGAAVLGYHSDITRTWARTGAGKVGSSASSAALDTYVQMLEALDALQLSLVAEVRAGVQYESIHASALKKLAKLLLDCKLARGLSLEALEASEIVTAFFPHGIGHSLGLQTHDVGCKPVPPKPRHTYLRHTTKLEAGQVVTIEPGVYFIPMLLEPLRQAGTPELDWPLVDALMPFGGARIEDNVHCTASDPENLTRPYLPEGGTWA